MDHPGNKTKSFSQNQSYNTPPRKLNYTDLCKPGWGVSGLRQLVQPPLGPGYADVCEPLLGHFLIPLTCANPSWDVCGFAILGKSLWGHFLAIMPCAINPFGAFLGYADLCKPSWGVFLGRQLVQTLITSFLATPTCVTPLAAFLGYAVLCNPSWGISWLCRLLQTLLRCEQATPSCSNISFGASWQRQYVQTFFKRSFLGCAELCK